MQILNSVDLVVKVKSLIEYKEVTMSVMIYVLIASFTARGEAPSKSLH